MIHSASPQSRPAVILVWFWKFRTDRWTVCAKIVMTIVLGLVDQQIWVKFQDVRVEDQLVLTRVWWECYLQWPTRSPRVQAAIFCTQVVLLWSFPFSLQFFLIPFVSLLPGSLADLVQPNLNTRIRGLTYLRNVRTNCILLLILLHSLYPCF